MNAVNSVKQRYAINFRGSVHDQAIALRDVILVRSPSEIPAVLAEGHLALSNANFAVRSIATYG